MYRKTFILLSSMLFLALAGTASAQQMDTYETVVANVPFDFVLEGKTLPSGTYRIGPLEQSHQVLLLRNERSPGISAVFFMDDRELSSSEGKLVFLRNENQYILSEIRLPIGYVQLKK